MFRFEAKEREAQQLWLNKGSTYEENVTVREDISVTKHGLKISVETKGYEDLLEDLLLAIL